MFAFTGPLINRNILKEKIQTVESGEMYDDLKYCCIRMFQSFGRRETHLRGIMKEYNQLAGDAGAIQLVALDGLPVVIPSNKHLGNPIEVRLQHDRMTKPEEFHTWTNIRNPTTSAQ